MVGLNHHGQLGYVSDPPVVKNGVASEPMQLSPRRVAFFRKDVVLGIAASKYHTAVFTEDSLYTWGAQKGQLGYASGPVQVQPRKVSAPLPANIIQVVATDFATVCLLDNEEVFVFFRNAYFKMNFVVPPSQFELILSKPAIKKISGSGSALVAISTLGDVFYWTLDESTIDIGSAARSPIRLWDLRKKFTAVTDAAVGPESIIFCTRSGHVYVASRRTEGAVALKGNDARSTRRQFKFNRIAGIQRIVKVGNNGAGGFAAIRSDVAIPRISTIGPSLASDLSQILPHWRRSMASTNKRKAPNSNAKDLSSADLAVEEDSEAAALLTSSLLGWDESWEEFTHGADIHIRTNNQYIPAHRSIIAARCTVLRSVLDAAASEVPLISLEDRSSQLVIHLQQCSPITCMLLLHYLYTDNFPCVWDPRCTQRLYAELGIRPDHVRLELLSWAERLSLSPLVTVARLREKVDPTPTLATDMLELQSLASHGADTRLLLSDG